MSILGKDLASPLGSGSERHQINVSNFASPRFSVKNPL